MAAACLAQAVPADLVAADWVGADFGAGDWLIGAEADFVGSGFLTTVDLVAAECLAHAVFG